MCGSASPPVTILLQGGIASGKSTVARFLARRADALVDCDVVAHRELEAPEVRERLRELFGAEVFGPAGAVQRAALARIVFQDPQALAQLEALIHPRVRERVAEVIAAHTRSAGEARQVVVIDAAVAEKMKLVADYDLRVFVHTSRDVRQARAERDRGWAPGELDRREQNQAALSSKQSEADFVVPNDGDPSEAESHVERFWTDFVLPRR